MKYYRPLLLALTCIAACATEQSSDGGATAASLPDSGRPVEAGSDEASARDDAEGDAFPDQAVPDAVATDAGATTDAALDGGPDGSVDPSNDASLAIDAAPSCVPSDAGVASSCAAGIKPGAAAGFNCGSSTPTITSSGVYPFTMTGAPHDEPLSCGLNYPNPREVVFGLCLSRPQNVSVLVSPDTPGQVWPLGINKGCSGGLLCGFNNQARLAPGSYFIGVEGYSDGTGELHVTLEPAAPVAASSCSDTQSIVAQDGAIEFGTYHVSGSGSGNAALSPSCVQNSSANPAVIPFALACKSQVTISIPPSGVADLSSAALSTTCGNSVTELGCVNAMSSSSGLFTSVLDPGTYYIPIDGAANLEVDAPPPTPNNLSCNTPTPIPISGLTEDRIATASTRYYTVSNTSASGFWVNPEIVSVAGSVHVELAASCGAQTAPIGQSDCDKSTSPCVVFADGAPVGTYSVAVTAPPGTRYALSFTQL